MRSAALAQAGLTWATSDASEDGAMRHHQRVHAAHSGLGASASPSVTETGGGRTTSSPTSATESSDKAVSASREQETLAAAPPRAGLPSQPLLGADEDFMSLG